MDKKQVMLVTWHTSVNYGTCLQCFALADYLRNEGYNVVVPDSFKYYYGARHPIETSKNIIKKLIRRSELRSRTESVSEEFKKRMEKNIAFVREHTVLTFVDSKKTYDHIISSTDFFLTGSDQIWNPNYVTPPMLLKIAPVSAKRIAYGSSIGVAALRSREKRYYKSCLSKFSAIGVRENTAKEILENLIDKKVDIILDPTFLLRKDEWNRVAERPTRIVAASKPFVFCYFIRKNIPIDKIEHYCKAKGLIPVYALSEAGVVPNTEGIVLSDAGVKEFIWGLANAELVITDSFHACSLSINYNKDFFVFKRFSDSDAVSQNSRIVDLLKTFELEDRLLQENAEFTDDKINYNRINVMLDSMIEKSKSFLKGALINNNSVLHAWSRKVTKNSGELYDINAGNREK